MKQVGWKSMFDVSFYTKKMIILTGNINDWQVQNIQNVNQLISYTLIDWIVECAKEKGFERVFKYDISSSIEQIYNKQDSQQQAGQTSHKAKTCETSPTQIMANLRQIDSILKDRSLKTLVVIEHTDKLFAHNQALQLDEKEIAVLLIKLSYDSSASTEKCNNLCILIYDREDLLPHDLFKSNPDIQMIHIPLPSNEDRREFFYSYSDLFTQWFPQTRQSEAHLFEGSTFDLTYKELFQLGRLSKTAEGMGSDSFEDLVNYFRFGQQANPWETNLNAQNLEIGNWINEYKIHGQNRALGKVIDLLKVIKAELVDLDQDTKRQPRGRMIFCGPTGVGKTMLCKKISQFIFGTEQACKIFAMGEYKGEGSIKRLTGADPSFVGYEQGGELTNYIREHPFSIIVFDEVEKANKEFWDLFLNILQEGKCTDGKGQIAYFNQCLIVFTSNIGMNDVVIVDTVRHQDELDVEKYFISEVRKYFWHELNRPELLGRIGEENIVAFNFLKDDNYKNIVFDKLLNLKQTIEKRNPGFEVNIDLDSVSEYICSNMVDLDKKGARGVDGFIREAIITRISEKLINYPAGKLNIQIAERFGRKVISVT
jgi:flagellar biosynthesis GTPase FlhF